jgi:L-asparaginase
MTRSVVAFATLGGTISMTAEGDKAGIHPRLGCDALLASVPGLDDLVEVRGESLATLPGASLAPGQVIEVVDWGQAQTAAGAEGVVICQGTDTIEESAYLASLYWECAQPLVFTGAMRGADQISADGPANILDACLVAASPASKDRGVMVVMDGLVHAASRVRKEHSYSLSAFQSTDPGNVGRVVEHKVQYHPGRPPRPLLDRPIRDSFVAMHETYLGDTGRSIRASISAGAEGIVVAAFGAGHVPTAVADVLEEAARSIPVVIASRTGHGGTLTNTYGFPGSESDLQARGAILAQQLDQRKARLLLWALLSSGSESVSETSSRFTAALNGDEPGPVARYGSVARARSTAGPPSLRTSLQR